MISSFISSSSSNTLFTRTNSSWLINESVKVLQKKTSLLFKLVFAKNTILSCFFFFFLIIELHFLIPSNFVQIFYPIAELIIPIRVPSKETKVVTETQSVKAEAK